MRNIKLTLQYDGANYSGWQIQNKEKTVQGTVENAVARITGEHTRVTAAARTDAGVHAFGQVVSLKTQSRLQTDVICRALNANLPHDIKIIEAVECPLDFHPRYDAKSKIYSYIIRGEGGFAVFLRRYSWYIPYTLSRGLGTMRQAAGYLIGEHDFSSFRGSGCGSKNPVRRIIDIEISEISSIDFMTFKLNIPIIKIRIEANAFLRHMVRNIVGTLVEIGRGKIAPLKLKEILHLKDRRLAGPTAPACGLFLERVQY